MTKRDFTLIELLIVIATIAIIAAIAIPNLVEQKKTYYFSLISDLKGEPVAAWVSTEPADVSNTVVTGYNDDRKVIFQGTGYTVFNKMVLRKEIAGLQEKYKKVWIINQTTEVKGQQKESQYAERESTY